MDITNITEITVIKAKCYKMEITVPGHHSHQTSSMRTRECECLCVHLQIFVEFCEMKMFQNTRNSKSKTFPTFREVCESKNRFQRSLYFIKIVFAFCFTKGIVRNFVCFSVKDSKQNLENFLFHNL
jgi:hypothetical protein